jgi:hypothetical protein
MKRIECKHVLVPGETKCLRCDTVIVHGRYSTQNTNSLGLSQWGTVKFLATAIPVMAAVYLVASTLYVPIWICYAIKQRTFKPKTYGYSPW